MSNGYNFGQANTLSPEMFAEQQDLNRQQRMAQMLMQQGQQAPQGQMISGRYVPPSIFQNLASLAQTGAGTYLQQKGDERALELSKALKKEYTSELNQFNELLSKNPMEAYSFAAQANSPQLQKVGMEKMIPKEFDLSEGQKRFVTMPDGSVREVAAGAQKPRAPLQIDTGTAIELRDPANPTVLLQRIPKSQMPTAGQVVERDEGTFLIDTRTGQAKPILGPGNQPLMGGGKPLTEVQGNAVGFAARAIEANRIATDLEKQGVRNTGAIRTAVGGVAGMTPFIGEELEQGVRSVFNVAPTFLGGTSPEQQKVEQARRDFVSAILRPESGAAIGVQEAKNEEKKYFPQAGDTEEVIQQKQQARLKAIEGLKAKAGPSGTRQINRIVESQSTPQGSSGGVVDFNSLPSGRR
jgi:hypothetical protein